MCEVPPHKNKVLGLLLGKRPHICLGEDKRRSLRGGATKVSAENRKDSDGQRRKGMTLKEDTFLRKAE